MVLSHQRLTVLGETFDYQAPASTAAEISQNADIVLSAGEAGGKFFGALRHLVLRQADTIEPEGAPRCDLIRRIFSEPSVREHILARGEITAEEAKPMAVDLSYGQLLSLGTYQKGGMRYTPIQTKTLYVVALWIGDGVTVGRGYELIESPYRLPVEVINVYRKPVYTFEQSLTTEQRETLRTLMHDGMIPAEAFETATLL